MTAWWLVWAGVILLLAWLLGNRLTRWANRRFDAALAAALLLGAGDVPPTTVPGAVNNSAGPAGLGQPSNPTS